MTLVNFALVSAAILFGLAWLLCSVLSTYGRDAVAGGHKIGSTPAGKAPRR